MGVHVLQGEQEVLGALFPIFTMGNPIWSLTVKCVRFVCKNLSFRVANISLKSAIRGLFGDVPVFTFKIKLGVYEKLAKSNS